MERAPDGIEDSASPLGDDRGEERREGGLGDTIDQERQLPALVWHRDDHLPPVGEGIGDPGPSDRARRSGRGKAHASRADLEQAGDLTSTLANKDGSPKKRVGAGGDDGWQRGGRGHRGRQAEGREPLVHHPFNVHLQPP